MNSPTPDPHKPRTTTNYLNNFQDPVGLAKRMICSGSTTAYWALAREAMRPAVMPVDFLMRLRERKLLRQPAELTHPVLLIVGPPRGGTTMLYQLLADSLDATWFPNVSEIFPRAPITATRMFARRRKRKTRLKSLYGQTGGLSAPNDGFHIWNRWLGTDRYEPFVKSNKHDEMQHFLAVWTSTFNRPLVNKNNRNTLCVGPLADIIPTAHIVALRRDPSDIARSLIRAREFVQGTRDAPWGLASRSTETEDSLGYVTDVCDQINHIYERLGGQLAGIDESRVTETSYEALCADPQIVIEKIGSRSGIELREQLPASLQHVRPSVRKPLSKQEEERLQEHLAPIDSRIDTQSAC